MLIFALVLAMCGVMVIRQINLNQGKHLELREAFILLYTKGYQPQAERLYRRLIAEVDNISNRQVIDDFQRTLTLVNPQQSESNNLVWNYHWTVSKELERRSWTTVERALKLAEEQ